MNDRTWQRAGILSGLVLAASLAIRTLITPTVPPPTTATATSFMTFFSDHQSLWLWTVWLTGAVVVLGTWFYGSLRPVLAGIDGGDRAATIFFGAWIIQGSLAAARHATIALPAMTPSMDPSIGYTLLGIASVMLGMVWFTFALQTVTVFVICVRSRGIAMWYVVLSGLATVIAFLGTFSIVQLNGHFSRTAKFRWVVLWTYIGWVAITSLVFALRKDPDQTN